MRYKNSKTGAVIETDCELKGGDWEALKAPPRTNTEKTVQNTAEKTVKKAATKTMARKKTVKGNG